MVTAIFTDIYLTRAIKVDSFYFALYISLFVGVGLILLIWLLIQDKPRLLEENDWGIAVFRLSAIRQLLIEKKIIKKSTDVVYGRRVGSLLYLPSSVFLDMSNSVFALCSSSHS